MSLRAGVPLTIRPSCWIALGLVVLVGCGGGSDGGTTPPPATVASVGVSLAASSIAAGTTTTATATPRDSRGTAIAGKAATWTSSNTAVATVDASGSVTGVSAGTAEIAATVDGVRGQASVTVTPAPVTSVTVTLGAAQINVGQTTQAAVVLRDGAGAPLTGRTVTWGSSNTAIATVSASGLVTGVAAGAAQISATSEGRSGQAGVTVNPALSMGPVALVNADGTPADTSRLAGVLNFSADINIPVGFRGVRQVLIRGVLIREDSITGSSLTAGRNRPENFSANSAIAISSIAGDQISTTVPAANGPAAFLTRITGSSPGSMPVSVSSTVNGTLANNDAFAFLVDGREVTSGGRTWIGGPGVRGFVAHASFTGRSLDRVEVVRAPAVPVYGSDAIAGVINVVTRTGSDVYREVLLPGSSPFESGSAGHDFALFAYTLAGQSFAPRTQTPNQNGNAASVDGKGFWTQPQVASRINLSGGLRYQPMDWRFPASLKDYSSIGGYWDFLPPSAAGGAAEPLQRNTTVGQPLFGSSGQVGLSSNYLGSGAALFSGFVDVSKISDAGSGLPATPQVSMYASSNLSSLYQPTSRLPGIASLPLMTTRGLYMGAEVADLTGNVWRSPVKVNAANPYTTGDVVASPSQYGIVEALFGKLNAGATVSTGLPSGSVFNSASTFSNYSLALRADQSRYPVNAFAGSAWTYGTPSQRFMGASGGIPEILGSTVTAGGLTATTQVSMSTFASRLQQAYGSSWERPFAVEARAWDHGGNEATGGFTQAAPWVGYFDVTRPLPPTVNVTTGANGMVTVNVSGTDNLGGESVDFGGGFALPHSGFDVGSVYAWFHTAAAGGNLTQGLSPSITSSVTGPVPRAMRWYDPVSGVIDRASAIAFDKICGRVRDWGHSVSPVRCTPYTPQGAVPAVSSNLSNLRSGITASSICNDETCSGGTPNEITAWLEADVGAAVDEIVKMFMLGIQPGGAVFPMAKSETPQLVMTLPGGGRRLRWETRFTSADYCMAFATAVLIKIYALSSDGLTAFIPSVFRSLNVVGGTGTKPGCTRPRRPLLPIPVAGAAR